MLKHAALTEGVWGEALNHAANPYNRTATPLLHMKTALEALLGTIPNIYKLRLYGCIAYMHRH